MNNTGIDTSQLEKAFDKFLELTLSEMKRASNKALAFASQILVKLTESNLLSLVPKARTPNPKYSDTLADGIMWHLTKGNEPGAKVHIMGSRDEKSGTFRLRFFAKGTKRDGKLIILPHNFFQQAISQTNGQLAKTFEQVLAESINKINNSK